MDDTIKQRLLKIKSLAERGEIHEAEIARRKLEEGLKRYGLSLEDLNGTVRKRYDYKYRFTWEAQLLVQLGYMVTEIEESFAYDLNGKQIQKLGFDFSRAEKAEFDWLWDYYRKEYKKDLDSLFVAFVHKHRMFGPATSNNQQKVSREKMARMTAMMLGLGSKTIDRKVRQIEG